MFDSKEVAPTAMFEDPLVKLLRLLSPTATLFIPVIMPTPIAKLPILVFLAPVVKLFWLYVPTPTFLCPVVQSAKTLSPIPTF